MFAAVVLLTSPIWALCLFVLFCYLTGGGKSLKQQAWEKEQKRLRNEEIKAAGRRAVEEGHKKGGSR